MNNAQAISLAVTPIITGCVSFIASSTIIVTILRSNLKLTTSYRRLVFMISIFDLLQSLSHLTAALVMPANTGWLAIGNSFTCTLGGFFTVLGFLGAVIYSFTLTVYFFLVIQIEMNDDMIQQRFEPFLHGFPILYSAIVSVFIFTTKSYNLSGSVCWIASRPENCRNDPDVDCESTVDPDLLVAISYGFPLLIFFFLNCIMLVCICIKVFNQTKKSQAYRLSWIESAPTHPTHPTPEEQDQESSKHEYWCPSLCCSTKKKAAATEIASPLAAYLSRPSQASVQRLKELCIRAVGYIIGFVVTYTFPIVYRLSKLFGKDPIPFTIILLPRFFLPLQGLFNVLVFTYPHIASYRRNHTSHSWFQAFWEVVKSGGDSDQTATAGRGRRGSMRNSSKNLSQIRQRRKLQSNFTLEAGPTSNLARNLFDENIDILKLEAGQQISCSIDNISNPCLTMSLSRKQNSKLETVDQSPFNDKEDEDELENLRNEEKNYLDLLSENHLDSIHYEEE